MECNTEFARTAGGEGPPGTSWDGGSLCVACPVRDLCIGRVAAQVGTRELRNLLVGRRRLRAGEVVQEPPADGMLLYAVRSGSLKSAAAPLPGERVRGFHFAGEVVGVASVDGKPLPETLTSLEDSELCALRLCTSGDRAYAGRLWDMMSRDLLRERVHANALAALPPARRVPALLASLAQRVRAPGSPARECRLRLSAADLAGYLRLPLADVQGVLATLAERRLLELRADAMRVVDAEAMARQAQAH